MILLSLNLRGIGGSLKEASFRRVLDSTHPNIIFLQETMVMEEKACSFLLRFHPTWATCAVSSVGTSGGLLVSWDPQLFNLVPFLTSGGILLTGSITSSKRKINFLNVYGPCLERKAFWTTLSNNGLLSLQSLVIAGDLNLTVSNGEVWGGSATSGQLASFFSSLSSHKLIDVQSDKLVPTWRNGRSGTDL
jgi:hypothetical protein